jgi:putative phosphoribosyl transferase
MHLNRLRSPKFRDRGDAGRQLAQRLFSRYHHRPNTMVLALPRGGLPVAHEVAVTLGLPLDVCLVRKLGVPDQAELAMGAIAVAGVRVLNQGLIDRLGIRPGLVEQVTAAETMELKRREQVYLQGRSLADLTDRTVILVDDGVATGATLRAAITILKQSEVAAIIVAVPVAHPGVVAELKQDVDDLVCVITPRRMQSISRWYEQFGQTKDETVQAILNLHGHNFSDGDPQD